MSGKLAAGGGGTVTKVDFQRLHSKVDAILARLSESTAVLRPVQSTATSPSLPSNRKGSLRSWLSNKTSGRPLAASQHNIDTTYTCRKCGSADVIRNDLGKTENLRRASSEKPASEVQSDIERCIKNELNQLKADVTRDIRSLQASIREVKENDEYLEKLLKETLSALQATTGKVNSKNLTNDCLGIYTNSQTKIETGDSSMDNRHRDLWSKDKITQKLHK